MRSVSLDWLEIFVNEDYRRSYEPEAFESRGYWVEVRAYGTKQFEQMFTILDQQANPMIEVRRKPRGVDGVKRSIYNLGDCYLRLHNSYCYHATPVTILMQFVEREKYQFKRIYRIDLALDLVRFDKGDLPATVARRIVKHVYAKINQSNRRTSGDDTFTECFDNWISWGRAGSMVSTKFYNKTKEIEDTKFNKTWIIQRWLDDHLIDNPLTLSKDNKKQEVWRIEFSIKSSAKEWIVVQPDESNSGEREYIEHSLDLYATREGMWTAIRNLIPHYFHFKIYEEGKSKYKCQDKILFVFTKEELSERYRLTNESDAARARNKVDADIYAQLKSLARVVNKAKDEEARQHVQRAITRLNQILHEQYTTEEFYRALMATNGDMAEAIQAVKEGSFF